MRTFFLWLWKIVLNLHWVLSFSFLIKLFSTSVWAFHIFAKLLILSCLEESILPAWETKSVKLFHYLEVWLILFSIFVMMDELTKTSFTKLGLESMPQRNHWIADVFFIEELQGSGDENGINLWGNTAAPSTPSPPHWSQLKALTFLVYLTVLATFSVLWIILSSSWGLLC